MVLDLLPALLRETHLREGLAVDLHLGSEDSHLLAVATIGVSTRDLVLLHAKLEGESLLQTRRVESSERSQLVGLQARVDESGEGSHVGRVEDDDHVLHLGAILLDVVAEVGSDLAVALEQVLAGHTVLAGSTTRGDDVLSTREGLFSINGVGDVGTLESTLLNLIEYAMNARLIDIVEANVRSEAEHQNALYHVRTNHTACADDNELVIC